MDFQTDDIDFGRVSLLMDIIQKVTTITPQDTYIMAAAQAEIREVNTTLGERITKARQERLAVEQARAAEINAENQAIADAEANVKAQPKSIPAPVTVMPGEPVSPQLSGTTPAVDSIPIAAVPDGPLERKI